MVQVEKDAEYLQGSMRFMGSLFREHHLPHGLVRTLVTDLASHSEKVPLCRHVFYSSHRVDTDPLCRCVIYSLSTPGT